MKAQTSILGLFVLMFALTSTSIEARAERLDLELVLLADATGSIDDEEIRFQRQGYATALQSNEVLDAISQGYFQKIAVVYVEWGSEFSQDVVVPWTVIDSPQAAKAFADSLMSAPRKAFGRNAIGSALAKGIELIEGNEQIGTRRVIDLSADSANNWNGPPISEMRDLAYHSDIIINGLAVLCRHCNGRPVAYDLEQRFYDQIIVGPGSFVVTADGETSFADAVRKKLILEIADTSNYQIVQR